MKIKSSFGDKIFNVVNVTLMLIICFLTLYPVWYIIVYSFNEGKDAMLGGIYFWPRKFTLDNYKTVFSNSDITTAFMVTVARTVITTTLHVFFTAMVAYAFLRKELMGRKIYMAMGTITLFFGGGLIPYFLLIKSLGLYNTFWVYVIPGMFNFYNLIIFQAFFRELPIELEESAKIDGANDFVIFTRI
ncbi:carbohydrate ABC transporter permease, partial [Caldicellulosiruptor sp. F32]|uniref:carbohydrate ABC transporter permease n=1 Tax=Caldicellulosiruptor sp. F32 TaxID=1214564 RepID=UPI00058479C1